MREDDEDKKPVAEEFVIVEDDPDDDSEDSGDERVARDSGDGNESEREAIRERRRQEKQERKDRRGKAISRDKLELDFLRKRNDDLERRFSVHEQRFQQIDMGQIDARINKAKNDAELAERVIAKAVDSGNGTDVTQAMRYRDQAMMTMNQLLAAKQETNRPQPNMPKVDDLTMHYAKEFIQDNPWYDAQGRDESSAIVLAIDQSLAKEGLNPQTEEYWDELRSRAARRLPEKFGNSKSNQRSDRQPRGGPAVGSGREHAPATTRNEVYINPDRKQALIDAGVWDDPTLRMRYVKKYAEYDRNNKQ
jgi:hypothetical protein